MCNLINVNRDISIWLCTSLGFLPHYDIKYSGINYAHDFQAMFLFNA